MEDKRFSVSIVLVLSALVSINQGLDFSAGGTPAPHAASTPAPTPYNTTTPTPTTAGTTGVNLNGKMFTLSSNGGGISFYPPSFSPTTHTHSTHSTTHTTHSTTPRTTHTTHSTTTHTTNTTHSTTTHTTNTTHSTTTHTTHSTTYTPPTTATPRRGVSVCLRYMADAGVSLFSLGPSGNALRFSGTYMQYALYMERFYFSISFLTDKLLWQNIVQTDFWTGVCLTLDSRKNVAQVFSGSFMSVRKILPYKFVWSGEPVINFPGFDGQVTDVHVWDYPLQDREVLNYMASVAYGPYSGSVITWSHISYVPQGNALLEDAVLPKDNQPIRSKGKKGRRPKGEKKTRKFFIKGKGKRKVL